jgi:monoglucosyldiacylglycerol epimerase
MLYQSLVVLLQAAALFLLATIAFDGLHFALHLCLKSKFKVLNRLGRLHLPHHRFYNSILQINTDCTKSNLISHVIFENVTQLIFILSGLIYFQLAAVIVAASLQMIILVTVCWNRGIDPHHRTYKHLPPYRGGWYVTAPYHALHHHYISNFYSSYIKVIDVIFGTAHHLANKNIVMTGASGALGSKMKALLEREGAIVTTFKYGQDYEYGKYDNLIPALNNADILFLCHGSKFHQAQEANCDSYIDLIELYKRVRKPDLLAPEIWATGSEIECHPCFGIEKIKVYAVSKRNYAKAARSYYRADDIQYRHLVHSAFMSSMGPGLMSANFAAKWTMFLLKRGFRYVPVSYTGFGYINYLRFLFNC